MNTESRNREGRIPVVLLFGPTAVGKTELLLDLFAEHSEIINADSMQVYRGMDIGTAKPGREVLNRIPHHLLDVRDPNEGFSAGDFVREADRLAGEIHERGRQVVVSGGTAFYLRNFIYGLPHAPRGTGEVRLRLERECEEGGIDALRAELERVDPVTAARVAALDRYRILRALEVYRSTGRPLSSYELPSVPRGGYRLLTIGLRRERALLYERIDRRVDEMIKRGLEEEVARLISQGYSFDDPGLRAIGYREFSTRSLPGFSIERTTELIKRNSRRYAKRQITFFKQLPGVSWVDADDRGALERLMEQFERG